MSEQVKKDNSRMILSIFLIVAGILWLFSAIGVYLQIPDLPWKHIFAPFQHLFHRISGFVFSWQMILILVGLILMAGNRKSGLVLVVVGGIFIIPKIFVIPGLTASIIIPVALIVTGIAMVAGRTG